MKTHRLPNRGVQNHLTIGLPRPLEYKPMILYSLFKIDRFSKRWIQVRSEAFDEKTAYWVFKSKIAEAPLSYSIRPIRIKANKVEGITKHSRPHYNSFKEFVQTSEQEHNDKQVFSTK